MRAHALPPCFCFQSTTFAPGKPQNDTIFLSARHSLAHLPGKRRIFCLFAQKAGPASKNSSGTAPVFFKSFFSLASAAPAAGRAGGGGRRTAAKGGLPQLGGQAFAHSVHGVQHLVKGDQLPDAGKGHLRRNKGVDRKQLKRGGTFEENVVILAVKGGYRLLEDVFPAFLIYKLDRSGGQLLRCGDDITVFGVDDAVCRGHSVNDHVIGVRPLSLGHAHA